MASTRARCVQIADQVLSPETVHPRGRRARRRGCCCPVALRVPRIPYTVPCRDWDFRQKKVGDHVSEHRRAPALALPTHARHVLPEKSAKSRQNTPVSRGLHLSLYRVLDPNHRGGMHSSGHSICNSTRNRSVTAYIHRILSMFRLFSRGFSKVAKISRCNSA